MKKDKNITMLVISIITFLALVLSAAYALIGVTTIYDDSNIVSTLGTRPIFVSDASDQITLDIPYVPVEASEEYLLTNDTGVVNISLSTNYEVSTRCTYDIVWQWDEVADTSMQYKKTEGATKEYTISGSNGVDSFEEIQLNDYDASNLKTKLYTTSITAVKDIIAYQDWDITANFYKTTTIQDNHKGASYSGKIVIENVVCSNMGNAFAVYSEYDNSLIFYKNNDVVTEGEEYKGKVATAVYPNIELDTYTYDSTTTTPSTPWYEYASVIKTVSVANEIHPVSTAMWFTKLINLENINLTNLNTSRVVTMERMFDKAGQSNSNFVLNLGDKFDTSNVTNMSAMFQYTGQNSTKMTLDLGDKFDTSKVTNMAALFNNAGKSSINFELDLGDKFDTSNVTNMRYMFQEVGRSNPNFTLDLGSKFDTSNVTDMFYMFNYTGLSSTKFNLNLGDKFDTSNVMTMEAMFANVGRNTPIIVLDLGDKFDTSNVTNMADMFNHFGYLSSNVEIKLGDKFDTSHVTNMYRMFLGSGANATNFVLDVSGFIIKSSCNLTKFAEKSSSKIIFGEGWSNATLVSGMFAYDSSKKLEIVNAPANILAYDFASDNRVPTFTTI